MWKIKLTNFVFACSDVQRVFLVIALLLWLTGCTLRFKAKELDIDAHPPEAKIGLTDTASKTYHLAAIDILKNADN